MRAAEEERDTHQQRLEVVGQDNTQLQATITQLKEKVDELTEAQVNIKVVYLKVASRQTPTSIILHYQTQEMCWRMEEASQFGWNMEENLLLILTF